MITLTLPGEACAAVALATALDAESPLPIVLVDAAPACAVFA
jgi:hypothetical protein